MHFLVGICSKHALRTHQMLADATAQMDIYKTAETTKSSASTSSCLVQSSVLLGKFKKHLLLILSTRQEIPLLFQQAFQVLINGERHSLSRRNTHNSRRDALVETSHTLRLPHVVRDLGDAAQGRVTRLSGRLLQSRLDGVDGGV